MFMIWTALGCLIFFIDSIVWSGNVIDWFPTWCDISTHFVVGFNLAIPATSLCINRRLYYIAAARNVPKTRAQQRRGMYIDFAIALGLPVLQIPLRASALTHCFAETYMPQSTLYRAIATTS